LEDHKVFFSFLMDDSLRRFDIPSLPIPDTLKDERSSPAVNVKLAWRVSNGHIDAAAECNIQEERSLSRWFGATKHSF